MKFPCAHPPFPQAPATITSSIEPYHSPPLSDRRDTGSEVQGEEDAGVEYLHVRVMVVILGCVYV
jgi:hypothetical protein